MSRYDLNFSARFKECLSAALKINTFYWSGKPFYLYRRTIFYQPVSGLSNDKARSFFSYKAEALSALWIELPKLNEDKFNGIKCSTSILNYSES